MLKTQVCRLSGRKTPSALQAWRIGAIRHSPGMANWRMRCGIAAATSLFFSPTTLPTGKRRSYTTMSRSPFRATPMPCRWVLKWEHGNGVRHGCYIRSMTDYTATMENTSMFPAVKVTSDFPEESDSVRKLTKLSCVGTAVNNPASFTIS